MKLTVAKQREIGIYCLNGVREAVHPTLFSQSCTKSTSHLRVFLLLFLHVSKCRSIATFSIYSRSSLCFPLEMFLHNSSNLLYCYSASHFVSNLAKFFLAIAFCKRGLHQIFSTLFSHNSHPNCFCFLNMLWNQLIIQVGKIPQDH